MKLKLGFSPCPNDTFMFDAIVNKKIDLKEFDFEIEIIDVEHLNKLAFDNILDITKISFHAYAYLSNQYQILLSGSALGNNNGPLLISKIKIYPDEVPNLKIAIPGKYTTANLLLDVAFPKVNEKNEYLFSDIEEAVLSNEVDAGLIIHENRFTYQEKGLKKIIDLGEYWEDLTHLPIPLGGIIIKKAFSSEMKKSINSILKESIEFAMKNPFSSRNYIKQYSQNLKDDVINKHIDLYVNDYSVNLNEEGRRSIEKLYQIATDKKIIPEIAKNIFI